MSYQLKSEGVTRLADGANVPEDTRNADWREYLKWVAEGNVALPALELVELDKSELSSHDKAIEVALLAAAAMVGKTEKEARDAFKVAWNSAVDVKLI